MWISFINIVSKYNKNKNNDNNNKNNIGIMLCCNSIIIILLKTESRHFREDQGNISVLDYTVFAYPKEIIMPW